MSPVLSTAPRRLLLSVFISLTLTATVLLGPGSATADNNAAPRRTTEVVAANPVTPGNFRGYGFDQCLAPTQATMNKWLNYSPFLAVGIYISGDSRACRSQPNLTPTWIRNQLARGWKLLPITLGPQASCQPRFPRYKDDFKISAVRGDGSYPNAKTMGTNEATKAVAAANALGIVPGSTLWYDLEAFDIRNRDCRESALHFLSAWTKQLHALKYVSGVYSSAGSGIDVLDEARVKRPRVFTQPDRIWVARWDGIANTSTSYIREDGWRPGNRVKQYKGGHDEVWGNARINIDSNYLDLGNGTAVAAESHCNGVAYDFAAYPPLVPGKANATYVKMLQCLLTEGKLYTGKINGNYDAATIAAVRAWQGKRRFPLNNTWNRAHWVSMLASGNRPVLKTGSTGVVVRRVQRALNAAKPGTRLAVNGLYDARTQAAVLAYQKRVRVHASGITNAVTWAPLSLGKR